MHLKKSSNLRYITAHAKYEAQIIGRVAGNARPLTAEEGDCLLRLTWESFDHIFRLVVEGVTEYLKKLVADPAQWQKCLDEVMLATADAVPVDLHPGTSRIAVSLAELDERNKRSWAMRNPK